MGNNDLSNSEKILVKVDQNNLMYIDPNSVMVNGEVQPRGIKQENLVMFVNLEADIVPRSTLISDDDKNTLKSIAKGTLNFLSSATGDHDYTTEWTDSYFESTPKKTTNGANVKPADQVFNQSDQTGQSFGIDNISILVKGANFIPQININFIDVRGKTLFESPENSPYQAFFHLPWPIFYLTVKGFYGKAIRYRLHLVKFNSKFNEQNGNFEIATSFVGSSFAFMNDIPLKGILNAPYMFLKESTKPAEFNESTGKSIQKVFKSSKGYAILNSVYAEMKRKKLIPQNFPVKTVREIGAIAETLDKILEQSIFNDVIDMRVLAGLQDYDKYLTNFEKEIKNWASTHLNKTLYEDTPTGKDSNGENTYVRYYGLSDKNKSDDKNIKGKENYKTLEGLITLYSNSLKESAQYNNNLQKKSDKSINVNISFLSKNISNIGNYYKLNDKKEYVVAIDKLVQDFGEIRGTFFEQKQKIEKEVERQMNEVVKSPTLGIGFEPTVRNLFAVLLANAEVYVRLLKEVHQDAFNVANDRKNKLKGFDDESIGASIYPWPEIKRTLPTDKKKVIAYPGEPELREKLKSNDPLLWPEVAFVEEFIAVATNKSDPNTEKEGGVNNISYIFESDLDDSKINQISSFFEVSNVIPYSDRSLVSFLYELHERAKFMTLVDSFSTNTIKELVNIEFDTIKEVISEEPDLIDILNTSIKTPDDLKKYMTALSPFERTPYYKDSIATQPYIKDLMDTPFNIKQYDNSITKKPKNENLYSKINEELLNYTPEPYRKNIYPFNSPTYTTYLDKPYSDNDLKFKGVLQVRQDKGHITTPVGTYSWVKDIYRNNDKNSNLFTQEISLTEHSENILNTPYFHKQLYSDFTKTNPYSKYVGSAYLLINSLPFVELTDKIGFVDVDSKQITKDSKILPLVRVSSLFKEVASTQYVPYHLIVKWGSLYHRYKKKILENVDILDGFLDTIGTTTNINASLFFNSGRTDPSFSPFPSSINVPPNVLLTPTGATFSGGIDVGIHPYYDAIYHQVVNGYNHYEVLSTPPIQFTTSNTFNVTNNGTGNYIINGSSNPTLNLTEGQTYRFIVDAVGHPFWIKTTQTTGTDDLYWDGITNNGTDKGTITFVVPYTIPPTIYYNCQYHSSMKGTISIIDTPTPIATVNTSYYNNVINGAIKTRGKLKNGLRYWTSFVDNSKFNPTDLRYTTLPCDGDNKNSNLGNFIIDTFDTDSFDRGNQIYYSTVWQDKYINGDYSGRTFFKHNEYNKNIYDEYSVDGYSKKVIDLIGTFSPAILDQFEEIFLEFATEKLNEEVPYKKFSKVKYDNFQDLLKGIVSVKKETTDEGKTFEEIVSLIKDRQSENKIKITDEILDYSNLLEIKLGNPKELDPYIIEGFVDISGNSLKYEKYNSSQSNNVKYIELYIGEDISGHYLDFFIKNNIELSEENVLKFRPLILIYAGYRQSGGSDVKKTFQDYISTTILNGLPFTFVPGTGGIGGLPLAIPATPGANARYQLFISLLIAKFGQLKNKEQTQSIDFVDGYNNRNLKIELYNFFKSFNDKWSSGNSIGQRLLMEEFLFLDKANKDIGDKAYLNLDRFVSIIDPKNDKASLYSSISMLIQGSGFDMRTLPAYVNFYGNGLTTRSKITPSHKVANNLFGTFLEVDYQESSPKTVVQFVGPSSKHPSDMNKNYKFSDDSFNISNVNNNPLIVTLPQIFDTENLSKSNKVVAFEVSFGDQNQSMFKGVSLDQSTIKNTSESFVVLENLARSESGAGTYNVDIGLFDYYRQASYSCEVTCMGNVMIQPTMFFYLKNIPMFRGSYWITEVSHNIRNNSITTTFKGSRIPQTSLPDPEDSFVSSYKSLFDKLLTKAKSTTESTTSGKVSTEQTLVIPGRGNFTIDTGTVKISGEEQIKQVGITSFGVPYNGFNGEKYIQKVNYKGGEWFRAVVARMGSEIYPIANDVNMSIVSRFGKQTVTDKDGKGGLTWGELKNYSKTQNFYSTKFILQNNISPDHIGTGITTFLNPDNGVEKIINPSYSLNRTIQGSEFKAQGPVNIGPSINGYGIALSESLMKLLNTHEGRVIYFKINKEY